MNADNYIRNLSKEMEHLEMEIRRHGMILASVSASTTRSIGDLSCPAMAGDIRHETFFHPAAQQ